MSDVIELVAKNLKNLIRAKASSVVVILGPLLIIMLAGLAFDTSNAYAVKIGYHVPDHNEVTASVLDQLRTEFKVYEYRTEQACIDAIKKTSFPS